MPDIDIDFADRNVVLDKLKHRVAKLDTGKKHNTGVYHGSSCFFRQRKLILIINKQKTEATLK